ncbi:GGDEF domain-containing protein [Massilia forsythiae]|uniref:diguanylate cyclase n=1 Tax=Massilia forsythiae TaxID=2728020 RepID=A0A7Z2VYJ4_9BURK|nr:GGDEF domain-containing protein [Massilia forsythiae]QJE01772.1 GGDEF domain-containing protein [Massilia forsythiae]
MLSTTSLFLLMMAMSAVMLLVLSSQAHSGARGIREWSVANAMAMAAMPLFAARDHISALLSIELANALMIGTSVMMYAGFRRHLGCGVQWRALGGFAAATMATVVALHVGIDSTPLRVAVVSLLHGGLCMAMCRSVWTALPAAPRRYPYLFTMGAAFGIGIGLFVRGAAYGARVAGWLPSVDVPTLDLVFFACGTLSIPTLTLGAVMMANAEIIARANHAADHDHLTGAPSRRAFFAAAERERAHAARTQAPMSLLLFDVDHFKRINDTHGHAAGDRVLVEIVARTGALLRSRDLGGRLGGEEFAVLLPATAADTALHTAERLRAALQCVAHDPSVERGADDAAAAIGYTVSIGVATLAPGETVADLLSRADTALYAAKAAGRNRVMAAAAARHDGARRRA